jgi:hypothetical protein
VAVGAVVLAMGGCTRGPGPIQVSEVAVASGSLGAELREAGLDDAALDGAARAALSAAGFRSGKGPAAYRAMLYVPSVRILPPAQPGAGPRVEVVAEVVLSPAEPGDRVPRREVASAAEPLDPARPPREGWLAALRNATQRAAEGLALAFAAEAKSTNALVADLTARDARVREHAIRVAGERKTRAAVPVLIARLKVEEPRLAHRIVAALALIGDERAVAPLIEMASGMDSTLTARIVRFIGDIGGEEAEGYLLTLESGHPDPRIRTAARKALDEMSAREGAAVAARK